MSGVKGKSGSKKKAKTRIKRTNSFPIDKYEEWKQYAREVSYKTKKPYSLSHFIIDATDRYLYMVKNNML
jgi:hypothetical protein